MKIVQIRSFFCSVFSTNTRKYGPEKNSVFEHFWRSNIFEEFWGHQSSESWNSKNLNVIVDFKSWHGYLYNRNARSWKSGLLKNRPQNSSAKQFCKVISGAWRYLISSAKHIWKNEKNRQKWTRPENFDIWFILIFDH